MDASHAKQLVRGLIEAEFSSGFPFVRRMPSTHVWKSLAHVETLTSEERDTLFDVLAERGSAWLQTDVPQEQLLRRQMELVRHPAYQRYCAERTQAAAWKYADPRFLRKWLDGWLQTSASLPAPLPPPDFCPEPSVVVEHVEPPITAKAPAIRKEVKSVLGERFRVQSTKMGAGVWNYAGDFDGRPFTLTLDYGGTFMKLRYGVSPGRFATDKHLQGQTWEGMLGFGIGADWDFVCQHNLSQSVALLGEIIEKLVKCPEELLSTT